MPANARSVVRALAGILSRYSFALASRVLIKSTQFRNFVNVSVYVVTVPVATFAPHSVDVIVHQLNASVKFPRFPNASQRVEHFPISRMSWILGKKIALMLDSFLINVDDIRSGFYLTRHFPSEPVVFHNRTIRTIGLDVVNVDQAPNFGSVFRECCHCVFS
jgi:hypothetical protein